MPNCEGCKDDKVCHPHGTFRPSERWRDAFGLYIMCKQKGEDWLSYTLRHNCYQIRDRILAKSKVVTRGEFVASKI